MKGFRATAATSLALSVLMLSPAMTHLQVKTDPNDTQGRLDIRKTSFNLVNGKFVLKLETQGSWTVGDLGQGEGVDNQFGFGLDSRGGSNMDFTILIDNFMGELRAGLINSDGDFVSFVPAFKQGKTVGTRFRKGKVDPRGSHVDWVALSRAKGNHVGCSSTCNDYAPNQGDYRHEL